MIRVTYSHHIFLEQEFGGVSRYFYELATRVAQDPRFDAAIIAPCYVNHYLRRAPAGLVRGAPMPRFEFRGAWRIRKLMQKAALAGAYRGMARAEGIIHETYYASAVAGKAKRRVLTVYDMIHELFPQHFPEQGMEAARAAKRDAVARADHIICISEATRRDLVRLLEVDPGKTSVVHLAQDLAASAGPAYALPSGKPFLLYVGARGGYKNFMALCKAYAASPRLRDAADLVAFGGGTFTAEERRTFAESGISAHLHHAEGGDALLATYYRGAAAFVYPSLYEGFGLPLLEAMACGCPVACSNASSIPEVAGNAALYMDPRSLDDMRAALETITGDAGLRDRLIGAGKARAAQFSWERCARETMDIYRAIA